MLRHAVTPIVHGFLIAGAPIAAQLVMSLQSLGQCAARLRGLRLWSFRLLCGVLSGLLVMGSLPVGVLAQGRGGVRPDDLRYPYRGVPLNLPSTPPMQAAPMHPTPSRAELLARVQALDVPYARGVIGVGQVGAMLTTVVGAREWFTAVPRDAAGGVVNGLAPVWRSSDATVVRVTAQGLAEMRAPGRAEVTGQVGTVTVTVTVIVERGGRRMGEPVAWLKRSGRVVPAVWRREPWAGERSAVGGTEGSSLGLVRKLTTGQGGGWQYSPDDPLPDEVTGQLFEARNTVGTPVGRVVPGGGRSATGSAETNGNANYAFGMPLVELPGRGEVSLAVGLSYNSAVWAATDEWSGSVLTSVLTYDPDVAYPAPGFRLGYGHVEDKGAQLVQVTGSGTRRGFRFERTDGSAEVWAAQDGSFDRVVVYARSGDGQITSAVVQSTSGVELGLGARAGDRLYVTGVADRHGNYLNVGYVNNAGPRLAYIVDGLQRYVVFEYDEHGCLWRILAPDFGGAGQREVARLAYEPLTFGSGLFAAGRTVRHPATVRVLRAVLTPTDGQAGTYRGQQYAYTAYGQVWRVRNVIGVNVNAPVASGTEVAWTAYNYPQAAAGLSGMPKYTARTENWIGRAAGANGVVTTQYAEREQWDGGRLYRVTQVTQPDGAMLETWQNVGTGYVERQRVLTGGVSRTETRTTWEVVEGNPRVTEVQVGTETGESNGVLEWRRVAYAYGAFNTVTEVREYGYGGELLRRTATSYVTDSGYTGRQLVRLPSQVDVFDGATGRHVARTEWTYDEGALVACPGIEGMQHRVDYNPYHPGYVAATAKRGNVTRVTRRARPGLVSENDEVTTASYDVAGNVRVQSVGCCRQVEAVYGEGTKYTYATTVKRGAVGQLETQRAYDLASGLVVSETDANGQVTQYAYQAVSLRWLRTLWADGGEVRATYYDAHVWEYAGRAVLLGQVERKVASGQFVLTLRLTDGRGGAVRTATHTPDGWLVEDVEYDGLGRWWREDAPYYTETWAAQVGKANQWTTVTVYDNLSRARVTQAPDGGTVRLDYAGRWTTVTDGVQRSRRWATDALGRVVVVEEPDAVSGAFTGQQTEYRYDVLGHLVAVEQGVQRRYFRYDGIGRMTHARHPEMSAPHGFSDAQTGNGQWSEVTSYDQRGLVVSRVDGRGVTTSYSYDGLNRVVQIGYSDGTPAKRFVYGDAPVGGATPPANGRGRLMWAVTEGGHPDQQMWLAVESYDAVGRVTSQVQRYKNAAGTDWDYENEYRVGRSYNVGGQVVSETYPSGRVVTTGYDSVGRVVHVEGTLGGVSRTYVSGLQYTARQAVTREALGTGTVQWRNYRYDALGRLVDLRVGSEDAAWGRNQGAWQWSWSVAGQATSHRTFVPLDEAAAVSEVYREQYTYDRLGRLKRVEGDAHQLSGPWWAPVETNQRGQYVQENEYDRYGNRTVGSGSWGLSGKAYVVDAQTNRLGVPAGEAGEMVYDGAGQLVRDTYTRGGVGDGQREYDAEGRVVAAQVSGEVWERSSYDAYGRRVRVRLEGSGETRYVYGIGGEVLAEYGGGVSGASAPRVEYGYRLGEVVVEARGSEVVWRVSDVVGSTRAVVDGSGHFGGTRRLDYA
ncbi:MAG: hypothetical protein SNJ49_09255, partial [Chloracidobacterium sp.]